MIVLPGSAYQQRIRVARDPPGSGQGRGMRSCQGEVQIRFQNGSRPPKHGMGWKMVYRGGVREAAFHRELGCEGLTGNTETSCLHPIFLLSYIPLPCLGLTGGPLGSSITTKDNKVTMAPTDKSLTLATECSRQPGEAGQCLIT